MPYFTKKGTGKDKGKTCVYKKEDRTKVGCTAGPVKKYLAALHVNESEDLEWMMGSPKVRLGELKGEIYDYVSPGDTIYITGRMFLEEFTFDELSDSLYNEGKFIDLYEEPATVLNMNENFRNSRLNVKFGENITSIPIWVDILNDDWIDLGAFQTDDDLLITLPNKSINESEDFGWAEDFRWTTDMLYSMLDNCNEIKVSNYSLTTDSPYLMRGEPVIYTLTRCEEWWDKFSQIPLDDNGRGPAEWYQDYDEGRIGLLATYESIHPSVAKYKNLRLVDFEKDGWTITQYPQEIVNSLNGKHTELFILLDDKGKPVYELIPEEHRERVKTNWEDRFFGEELNESEGLDWIRDEGKEREIIIDDLNKFVNELNNRFRVKGDTLLELDYDSVEGGYYFGRVWVYNKIYELYQYGDKFKYVVHELIKNQHHPQGEEYQQVYENKDLPMKHFLRILKNGIANDYYRGYMDRVLSESKDFEWAEEISNTPLHNITFKIKRGGGLEDEYYPTIYTIKDDGLRSSVKLIWVNDLGEKQTSTYMRHTVNAMFRNHIWVPVEGPITESSELSWIDEVPGDFNVGDKFEYLPSTQHRDPYIVEFVGFKPNTVEGGTRGVYVKVVDLGENTDSTWDLGRRIFIPNKHLKDYLMKPNFMNKLRLKKINESDLDWIQKQEPERVMKKSKSYGIDVRHLKSEPPISPLSAGYSDLTKGDILDKLSSLGYDTQHIDVDKATYFYVEPSEDAGYWEDDVTWVEQTHWVDYVDYDISDPTFNGKYEMIDVDEFMFLIDNNLISESDDPLQWMKDTGLGGVDLRNCEPGDMLVTRSGKVVTYVRSLPETDYMDHEIQYPNGTYGSRTHDGYVYRKKRLDTDEDIIAILDDNFVDQIVGPTKPINEVAGISFEARKWAEIIYNEIIANPEEKTRLIIDGYDHPEAFDGFPIDYVVVDFYDRLTGYGQEHSGYDKDGNYVVLLYVQPKLVSGQGGYSLQSALNHEMKHAWEDYNRLSKGLPSIEQTKESQELYNRDYILMLSDQNIRGPIKEILKYYYYLSNLEKSAYLENVYDQNPTYERIVRDIASKDFESFKDRFDLDVNWHLMNTAYDIPFLKKFKSPREFIDYSAEELRSRALKMIKKINKMRYVHGKM